MLENNACKSVEVAVYRRLDIKSVDLDDFHQVNVKENGKILADRVSEICLFLVNLIPRA